MRWHDIYILLLALVFFCCASIVSAQNVIDVSECIKRSVVTKEAHLRKDRNGNICAVLQIEGPRIRDYKFECPYKVESVLYDEEHNQATVFVVADKKTKLAIFNPDCNKKIVELPALEGHYYYDLSVRVIDESRRNSSDADDDIIYDEKSTVELAFLVFPSNSTVVLRKLPERTDESGIVVRTVFPGQYHYRVNSDR